MVIAASDEQRLAARGVSGYGGVRRDRVRGGYVSLASARLSVVCFSVLWPIVLLSRGLVLSTLIESSAATILVQLAYIGLLGAVLAIDLILGRVRCLGDGFACFALMALHTVLFCLVLTNPMMPSEYSLTQSALLFVLVIGLTAYFIRTREIFDLFVRLSFYTIGGLLAFLPLDAPWGFEPVWCYEHYELVGQDVLCVRVRPTQLAGRSLLWLPRLVLSAAETPRAARAMGFFRNRGDRPCDAALSVREGNSFKVVDSWIEKAGVQELLTDFRPCSIKDLLRYLILRFRWYALARLFLRGE